MNYDEVKPALDAWAPDMPIAERISVLQWTVRYWYGEAPVPPQLVSTDCFLPPPLHWLYSEVAARNPDALSQGPWISTEPILYNSLRNPEALEMDASGLFVFLIEQQAVYRCAARAGEDDSPVFRQDHGTSAWLPCACRLSDFLLWAVLFELIVCRELTVWGYFATTQAARITDGMTHVQIENVSMYSVRADIYHGDGIALLSAEVSPNEICLQAVARSRQSFERLKLLGEWMED